MRYLINLLTLLFLFTSCDLKKNKKGNSKNDLEYNLLFGNVKSISTEFANDGYSGSNKRNLKIFNENKKLVKEIDFINDSVIVKQSSYKFNKNYQLIQSIKFKTSSKSKQTCKYKYNNNDSLISIICNERDFNTQTKIKRDFKNRIKRINHFINDSLDYALTYKRDLITGQKKSTILSSKSTWKETKYKYKNDLIIQKTEQEVWLFSEDNDTIIQKFDFEYYQNKQIKSIKTKILGTYGYEVNNLKYHNNKVLAEQSIQSINDTIQIPNLLIKWDRFGNVTLHQNYERNGVISKSIETEYEYDKLNNWISKKNTKTLDIISKRSIKYYK